MNSMVSQASPFGKLLPAVCCVAAILVTVVLLYHNVLTAASGSGLNGSDYREVIYPDVAFLSRSWQANSSLPLWDPQPLLGYSVVGNPMYPIYYPPYWVLLWVARGGLAQIVQVVGLMTVLHVVWAAFGFLLLARMYRASWWIAFIVGISAAGSYTVIRIYAGHFTILQTLAWVPWFFAGLHALRNKTRKKTIVLTGVALALLILAGSPPIMYLTLVGAILVTVGWLITGVRKLNFILALAAVGTIGIGISAPSLIPWTLQIKETARVAAYQTVDNANALFMPLDQAPGLFVPNLYGLPTTTDGYHGAPNYEETTGYFGILPVLCILLLLLSRTIRTREAVFWTAIILIGIWLSLGFSGGLYRLLVELPLLRDFEAPGRFLLLSQLGVLAVLALVLTRLTQITVTERAQHLRIAQIAILVITILVAGTGLLVSDRYVGNLLLQSAGLAVIANAALWLWCDSRIALHWTGIGLLCLVAVVDTARIGNGLVEVKPISSGQTWQFASEKIPLENIDRVMQLPQAMNAPQGIEYTNLFSTQGYNQLYSRYLFELLNGLPYSRYVDPNDPLMRLFNIRYAMAPQDLKNYGFISTLKFQLIDQHGDYRLYENSDVLPRVYVTSNYVVEPTLEIARSRLWAGEFSSDKVLLNKAPVCDIGGPASSLGANSAMISGYSPDKVQVRVNATQAGLLVLADAYDPGWQVTVNGQPAELLRADWALRSVCVPAGESVVEFTYNPIGVSIGRDVFIATAGGLILIIVITRIPWRRFGQDKTLISRAE